MQNYNLFADLFDTYQSLPDWLKVMWLIVPPGFVLWLTALIRSNPAKTRQSLEHQHVCSEFIDDKGTVKLYAGDDYLHPVAQLTDERVVGQAENETQAHEPHNNQQQRP